MKWLFKKEERYKRGDFAGYLNLVLLKTKSNLNRFISLNLRLVLIVSHKYRPVYNRSTTCGIQHLN